MNDGHTNGGQAGFRSQLTEGMRGLLIVLGQRYLVSLLEVSPAQLRVTFPLTQFPLAGMHVELEFHDDSGYIRFGLEVVEPQAHLGDGLVVRVTDETQQSQHRSAWRIAADFRCAYRDHVHPKRLEAPVINVSAGGLLMRVEERLDIGDNVDLWLPLPDLGVDPLLGATVHIAQAPNQRISAYLAGLRFVGLDDSKREALHRYVWKRVRELYPGHMGLAERKQRALIPPS